MTINGTDIRKYGAVQLTVDTKAPAEGCGTEWAEGSPLPRRYRQNQTYGTLSISLLFRGEGRDDILRRAGELIALLRDESILVLDGYDGEFICYYTGGAEPEKVKGTRTRYTMKLTFNYYRRDSVRSALSVDGAPISIAGAGSRDTPATVEITAAAETHGFTISGFPGGDIVISELFAGEKLIIDGERGTATVDGVNAFGRVELWRFPIIEVGKRTLLTLTADGELTGVRVRVKYRPMLLL